MQTNLAITLGLALTPMNIQGQTLDVELDNELSPNPLIVRMEIRGAEFDHHVALMERTSAIDSGWSFTQSSGMDRGRRELLATFKTAVKSDFPATFFRTRILSDVVRTPETQWERVRGWDYEPRYTHVGDEPLRIAYYDIGEGDPVVLFHGVAGWSYTWRELIPELLAIGRRVIAVDFPGFGFSDKPIHVDNYSKPKLDQWVGELLFEHLQIDNAVLLGHTYGVGLAIRLALQRESQVQGLIFIGPAFHDGGNPTTNSFFRANVNFFNNDTTTKRSTVINVNTTRVLTNAELSAYDAPHLPGSKFKNARTAESAMELVDPEGPIGTNQRAAWEAFQQWEKPILIFSSDDIPQADWPKKMRSIPGAQDQPHQHYSGQVRHPHIDFAQQFNERVRSFVADLE